MFTYVIILVNYMIYCGHVTSRYEQICSPGCLEYVEVHSRRSSLFENGHLEKLMDQYDLNQSSKVIKRSSKKGTSMSTYLKGVHDEFNWLMRS